MLGSMRAIPGEAIVRLRHTGEWRHVKGDVEQLRQDPNLDHVEPNYEFQLEPMRAESGSGDRWFLDRVGAPIQLEGPGPLVAVLDTGVDLTHPALEQHLWINPGEIPGDGIDNDGNGVIDDVYGYNANANTGDPNDAYGHGTHVAGIIASVAPNARILPIRIHDEHGSTTTAAILRGLEYARKSGAAITNNSYGGPKASYALEEAFNAFPAVHVMAAGNEGKNNDYHPHFPSNFDIRNSLVVAASTRSDERCDFSNYGRSKVDVAAPGEEIFSTLMGGNFGYKSGTSMAAPVAAGVAALYAGEHPEWSPQELRQQVLQGAELLPAWKGTVASGGRVHFGDFSGPSVSNQGATQIQGDI